MIPDAGSLVSSIIGEGQGRHREVWYIRDKWARDHEVLHPRSGCAL